MNECHSGKKATQAGDMAKLLAHQTQCSQAQTSFLIHPLTLLQAARRGTLGASTFRTHLCCPKHAELQLDDLSRSVMDSSRTLHKCSQLQLGARVAGMAPLRQPLARHHPAENAASRVKPRRSMSTNSSLKQDASMPTKRINRVSCGSGSEANQRR